MEGGRVHFVAGASKGGYFWSGLVEDIKPEKRKRKVNDANGRRKREINRLVGASIRSTAVASSAVQYCTSSFPLPFLRKRRFAQARAGQREAISSCEQIRMPPNTSPRCVAKASGRASLPPEMLTQAHPEGDEGKTEKKERADAFDGPTAWPKWWYPSHGDE